MDTTWVEISAKALTHNLGVFREIVGPDVILAPAVKGNAYGHGLVECARVLEKGAGSKGAGAGVLCVNALYEARALREAGIKIPLLIIGYTPLSELKELVRLLDLETVVYNLETIEVLGKTGKRIGIHLKIETGNHRQGIRPKEIPGFVKMMKRFPHLSLQGASTHFANLEDRIHHQYALYQLKEFNKALHALEAEGMAPHHRHCANTAATLLLPEARFDFVRVGIGIYGLWPSKKTERAARRAGIKAKLEPVLTWKTTVAQVKEVKKGALVGYGCTYEMPRTGRIAILPVGYYDGYDRLLSNKGQVLIRGQRAPVIGRVCMNIIMADVTDIPGVKLEDEAVLIGSQGKDRITPEEVGAWSRTINYEVTTRINERIPRIVI